ncbi:hypothetical protein PVAP13_4KG388801 [Panicum virgatum]|uniref:Reverse transcriptase zinc-binding domain-containing protein n=1 Tax=Panicum virgatum TaxID=38727 RepID=A0A8T0TS48_PANVG|nr:hypothetical protein PVAP13_4KG388801 [Panicum virgatum]
MDNKWGIHTSSAYRIQFMGRFKKKCQSPQFGRQKLNQNAKSLHGSSSTVRYSLHNLERRGWPHDPLCKLCNSAPETSAHLCKDCPYTSAVWTHVTRWFDLQQLPPSSSTSTVYRWWKMCRKVFSKEQKPAFDGLMICFWWNIWKKRNQRIFQQES